MFLYSRKRRKIWRWEVEWVKEPIPEISLKHFHSPNLPQTSPPCQTSVKSWRVESRSWQLGWQPARRRWEQGERSWSLRCASFFKPSTLLFAGGILLMRILKVRVVGSKLREEGPRGARRGAWLLLAAYLYYQGWWEMPALAWFLLPRILAFWYWFFPKIYL